MGKTEHSDSVRVIIRPFDPNRDQAFIYSSWRNAAYYGLPKEKRPGDATEFFKRKSISIRDILANAKVRMACLAHDPNTVVGYAVSTGTHLDFVYVKVEYRNQGIAKILVPNIVQTYTNNLTKIGQAIVNKKDLKVA